MRNKIAIFAIIFKTKVMNIIARKSYANKVDSWLGKQQIIVLTGQRRVGKSYIMKDFISRHKDDPDTNIIYVDKEKRAFKFIRSCDDLDAYIDSKFDERKHNYILIDEVQDIAEWEKSVRSYRTEENTDVIITGSNSRMLSSELSTLLGGRYEQIFVQGLSYEEFLIFHHLPDSDESLWKYLNYGGLPGLINIGLDNAEMVWDYLSGIYNTIMLKDVVERHNIRNLPFLHNLLNFIADTTGKLYSANSVSKFMKSAGTDISTKVVQTYLSYYEEAYLISLAERFDIHGKKLLETSGKAYFGDVGLRNFIVGGERENDIEKIIETVVYQHLIRMGYSVCIGQLRAGEIDFVCKRAGQRAYVQVAWLIDNEATRKREFGALQSISDAYPKYVISATPMISSSDYEGIKHLHLRRFLTEGLT